MKNVAVVIVGVLLAIAAVIALGFGALGWRSYFEPKHAEIDRQVFEQTPSFVHGKTQHLSRLRLEYERADTDASKESLRTLILSEAAAVDYDLLPTNLRTFLYTLQK